MAVVDFTGLTLCEGSPIYLQIISYVKRGIAGGSIPHLDEMPSRRVLSTLLGVNPNTIQKAYRSLEEEGLLESRSGAKSYILAEQTTAERLRFDLLDEEMGAVVQKLQQMGVTREDAVARLSRIWEETV